MPDKWTGRLVGKMHTNKVTRLDLANEMGVSKQYVTMILNGFRSPPGIKERMEEALNAVLSKRGGA